MDILSLIGRNEALFDHDINESSSELLRLVSTSRFLVIGGAGSIGQAVSKEIFKRNPKILHIVDINENNLVELVRDLRSTLGYIGGDFRTYAIDCASIEFDALLGSGNNYDYILNLSALKHVRSEKDPYTLMRMVMVNVVNTVKTLKQAYSMHAEKYFCVSTDKAANPVNMMGASKRIMEMFLMRDSEKINISTARFANVAFSDGSLLHGFNQRFSKRQPISAPDDVRRYFLTPQESGELCLMSCLTGDNRDIYFPKFSEKLHLDRFSDIAIRYLNEKGYDAYLCDSEEEARSRANELIGKRKWPCYFFKSDTTGEKGFEEFFTESEMLDMDRFDSIGIIKNAPNYDPGKLEYFWDQVKKMRASGEWSKQAIVELFDLMIPNFYHQETGKYLDDRM